MTPPIVLIPGFWLGAWAWDEVADELCTLGHTVSALTLPGLDPGQADRSAVTLDDHVHAIRRAVEAGSEPAVLVLHSGAVVAGTAVANLVPERVAALVYVDAGPVSAIGPGFIGAEWELPTWEELEAAGNSLDGLTPEQLATFRERAVAEPGAVVCGSAAVPSHPDRLTIPTTVVCCSLSSAQLVEAVASGQEFAKDLAELHDVTYVDLPTGHWPMFSRPRELAAILDEVALSR